MTNEDDVEIGADIEPENSSNSAYVKSSRKAFSKLAVELTDEELNSSGVQKMLLAEISRLESSTFYAEQYKDKYYNADKERAVLKEKEKVLIFSEILYSVSLTLGAVIIGLSPSIKSDSVSSAVIGLIGVILIAGSVIAKVVKK